MCFSKSGALIKNIRRAAQKFDRLVDEYFYNEATDDVELSPKKRDIYAEIQSHKDCALDRVLERFLPVEDSSEADQIVDYLTVKADLADYAEVIDRAEDYRARFDYPVYQEGSQKGQQLSVADIYARVALESEALKKKIVTGGKKGVEKKEDKPSEE